jgi:hypothetical protein
LEFQIPPLRLFFGLFLMQFLALLVITIDIIFEFVESLSAVLVVLIVIVLI